MPAFAVGIDLGTTNCALAFTLITERTPPVAFAVSQLVAAGETAARPLLPSFLFLEGEPTVGTHARAQSIATPARLVSSAKSWLSFAGVDRRAQILPWQSEGDKVSPLEASARFLSHLRERWDAEHPSARLADQDVVLTVPASFDAVARELTVEAAQLAGLPELRLLEEPQAALYAWLADQGERWRTALKVGDVILVVDIGGGTTDFSLISVAEEGGTLSLERVAVGEHILLGGDNIDLALALTVRGRMDQQLDDWQTRSLTHACRAAKEALLADASLAEAPLVIPSRGSKLIGGSIRTQLTRAEIEAVVIQGFLPDVEADATPQTSRRMGLTTLGLPYAQDAAITRHLAAFLHGHAVPTKVLFNGGVTKSDAVRKRVFDMITRWTGNAPEVMTGANPDLAVSRGAAYYANIRHVGGVRIKGGTRQAYYVGIERAELAVPGIAPKVDALCIAPLGMEEGSETQLQQAFGLYVGQPVSFQFFGSRRDDKVGAIVDPQELEPLAPIETSFEGEGDRVAMVKLQARVTEVGTLELAAVEQETGKRWKLSFNVRVE